MAADHPYVYRSSRAEARRIVVAKSAQLRFRLRRKMRSLPSSGRAVYATCLGDGEKTRWNRSDFTGVLDEQYLPDWAKERLEELRGPRKEQNSGPTMGGMM